MILHIQQRQNWIRSRRQRRKLAKAARLRRQVLRYLALAVLLAGGISIFRYVHWSISSVNPQVAVQGNQVVTAGQVRSVVTSAAEQPLYRLDPQVLSKQVCNLQDVQYCFVRRFVFPKPTIIVQVLEEFPWASLSSEPGQPALGVISESGRTIPINLFPDIFQPGLTLYAPASAHFDSAMVAKWAAWTGVIQAQTGQAVTYLDLRNNEDIRVMDGDLYLKIGCADSGLSHRLSRLASIVPTLEEFKNRLVYVDLSLDNNIPIKVAPSASVPSPPPLTLNTLRLAAHVASPSLYR